MQYIGQTGQSLKVRYIEHHRYIKTNEPKSAYALHILNNKHEYGPLQSTMELLKTCKKGWHMNILENFYIQQHYQKVTLMNEQHPGEQTPYLRSLTLPPTTCMRTILRRYL
jgi:hypothetical protein